MLTKVNKVIFQCLWLHSCCIAFLTCTCAPHFATGSTTHDNIISSEKSRKGVTGCEKIPQGWRAEKGWETLHEKVRPSHERGLLKVTSEPNHLLTPDLVITMAFGAPFESSVPLCDLLRGKFYEWIISFFRQKWRTYKQLEWAIKEGVSHKRRAWIE